MAVTGDRWPPVYDAEDLVREIKKLTEHTDVAEAFYEWRRDRSTTVPEDVCQGDVIELVSDVPVILEDGQPGTMDHPERFWLVIGNTCDFDRHLKDVRWTQLVPIVALGVTSHLSRTDVAAARKYTQARSFHVPSWSHTLEQHVHVADLLRPVGIDKRVLQGPNAVGLVHARLSRAAWILLNACLVRFLARDDGRYA
jgi:hypothetical protein